MATTLTATPRPIPGTVLLEVTAPGPETPTTVLSKTAAELVADAANWTGETTISLYGDLASFYCIAANQRITRNLTALVVGRKYRVTLTAQRTLIATVTGVTGKVEIQIPQGAGVWPHVLEFTASATSHQLYLDIVQNNNPYVQRLLVELLPAGTYDLDVFTLTRTDANGIAPVRLLEGQEITDGTLVVEDSEAALVGAILYRLTSASGVTTTTSTTLEGTTGTRLHPTPFPQWATTVPLVTGYTASRTSSTTAHEVIGRTDPVLRLGAPRTRRGTLTLWCADYPALLAAVDVYRRGEVVMLRQPDYPGLDLYHAALELSETGYDEEYRRWRLDVTYVEVGFPRGALLGSASWTWDDVVATYPTWDALLAAYPTWNAAMIGPTL